MHSSQQLTKLFEAKFNIRHFPGEPASLYNSSQYILSLGGKRIRPVMCLMGNELFNELNADVYNVATAIELFHNFTLIHDDIMDKAPLRRGVPTVHAKFGESTALLSGDVMLVTAYEYLNKIKQNHLFEFGKNLGIAFQVQDDYLDAFGDPAKFGKQTGGDILANKKTFLLIHALEVVANNQTEELKDLLQKNAADKIEKVLQIF